MQVNPENGDVTLFAEPDKQILHLVTAHIQRCKLPVDSLNIEQGRLDDVFREITQLETNK